MPAGHSHTPLLKKLGIKSGQRLIFISPPDNYGETLGPLPQSLEVSGRPEGLLDFIQLFTARRAELQAEFPRLKDALSQDGMLRQRPCGRQGLRRRRDLVRAQVRPQGKRQGRAY